MKRVFLIGALSFSLFASDKILSQEEALKILKVTPIYARFEKKIKEGLKIKGQDKGDFYILTIYDKKGEGNFFVSKDLKYTIFGTIIDNQKKEILRPTYPPEPFKGDKKVVENGVVFTIGKGDREIYVVTDPECPFCRQFEKRAEKVHFEDKYKIHVIFMPLSFHKHSKQMIYYILSAKSDEEKIKRFRETLQGGNAWKNFTPTAEEKKRIDETIKKSEKAAEELQARGTPTFYDKNLMGIKDRETLFK